MVIYIYRSLFCIFRFLPPSNDMFLGKAAKRLRAFAAKGFIKHCGKNVNIERGAIISSKLSIGDNSGIGIDCVCGGELIVGNNVMMGPECVFFQDSISSTIPTSPCVYKDLRIRSLV